MLRPLTTNLLIGLTCVFVGSSAADDAPPPRKVALLVGVNKYLKPGFKDLQYAEADVKAVGAELTKLGFSVSILLGSGAGEVQATKANIEAAAKDMVRPLGKHDIALIMLSGHGQQLVVDPKKLDFATSQSYYCPVDARLNDPQTQVSLSYLLDDVLSLDVGRKMLLVDACRDIPADPTPDSRNARGIEGRRINLPEGTGVYFSCSAGQMSFEKAELEHGLFTYCVLEALRGKAAGENGDISWSRLVAHVDDRMTHPDLIKLMPQQLRQVPIPSGALPQTVLGRVQPTPRPDLPGAPRVATPNAASSQALFNRALTIVRALGDESYRNPGLRFVAIEQARSGDFEGALQTAGEIQDEDYHQNAIGEIVREMVLAHRSDEALQIARSLRTADARCLAFHFLGRAQAQTGELANASASFEQAIREATVASNRPPKYPGEHDHVLSLIAPDQARADLAAALRTVRPIETAKWRALAMAEIAVIQAESGDAQSALALASEALQILSTISDDYQREEGMLFVIEARFKAGDRSAALEAVERVRHSPAESTDDYRKFLRQRNYGRALVRVQDLDGALDIWRNLNPAGFDDDGTQRSYLMREIARRQMESGDLQAAIQSARLITANAGSQGSFFGEIAKRGLTAETDAPFRQVVEEGVRNAAIETDEKQRGSILMPLVSVLAQLGDTARGLQVAESISNDYHRGLALASMATAVSRQESAAKLSRADVPAPLPGPTAPAESPRPLRLRKIDSTQEVQIDKFLTEEQRQALARPFALNRAGAISQAEMQQALWDVLTPAQEQLVREILATE